MDDKEFDDLLRNKFEDYEHQDADASALESFRDRMASFPSTPFYVKFRTELSVASMLLLFTALNALMLWRYTGRETNATEKYYASDRVLIDSLGQVIRTLKSDQQRPSVYVINPDEQPAATASDKTIFDQPAFPNQLNASRHTSQRLHLGSLASLPSDVTEKLKADGLLEIENGDAYLLMTDRVKELRHTAYVWKYPSQTPIVYDNDINDDHEIESLKFELPAVRMKSKISTETINKMQEQKYVSGIGINLASHVDVVKAIMSQGTGAITPRVGITAEWIVSPHWSIETSADYVNVRLAAKDDFQSFNLPNLNPQFGSLISAEINTQTLSSPVSLKFRRWISHRHLIFAKTGYTPYFSLNNKYVYEYPYPGGSSDDLSINTVVYQHNRGFYGGTLNFSVGMSRLWHTRNQVELSLFYEKSLGKVGPQQLGMQLFGIRTAYSIRIR